MLVLGVGCLDVRLGLQCPAVQDAVSDAADECRVADDLSRRSSGELQRGRVCANVGQVQRSWSAGQAETRESRKECKGFCQYTLVCAGCFAIGRESGCSSKHAPTGGHKDARDGCADARFGKVPSCATVPACLGANLDERETFLRRRLTFKTGELAIVIMCDARARVILGKVTEFRRTEPRCERCET